jgi:hypothetical protein
MKNPAILVLLLLSLSFSARAQTERPRPSLDLAALSAPLEDLRPDEKQILDEAIQLIQRGDHGLAFASRFERVPFFRVDVPRGPLFDIANCDPQST